MFPELGDPEFRDSLMSLEEYQMFHVPPLQPMNDVLAYEEKVAQFCSGFEKTLYQHLMQHYLSYRSPYRSILLYHGLGVGKTCSSITIAESLLVDHSSRDPPKVWVVLPTTLQDSYMEQLFSFGKMMDPDTILEQCTGTTYDRLAAHAKTAETKKKRIEQLIKGRYKMMTYEGFASEVEKLKKSKALDTLTNKVIIVDEAHNLRIEETDKRVAKALMEVAKKCNNNRLVLLSATPMYNEPDEIFWLLSLLLANDKRKVPSFKSLFKDETISRSSFAKLQKLSSEYISYIRGANPFTFATRFSPSMSGIPLLGEDWASAIPDGLVPTELGEVQKSAMESFKKSDAVLHQADNVCFPVGKSYKVGKKGFDAILGRDDADGPFKYKNTESMNLLMPSPDHLGKYGTKIKRICDLIRNSRGIVVVYSQFVWGGIVPLAAALEHMGFQRHAASPLLHKPDIMTPRATYPGVPFPTYCIISGDAQIMGGTRIDELVRDINRSDNAHGERVKVVLMSPIAGEGLSLKNIREVHVMDPWYHVNRLQQVIGRAIRTCSHTSLPLRERNVTVFLHVATNGDEETMDLHTYKIAARKSLQTKIAEVVIRDHAIDCSLVKNVHYFPKSLFNFDITYETSRGNEVTFQFGDDAINEPACRLPSGIPDATTMRTEVISELVPTGLQRLRRYLKPFKDSPTPVRITEEELLEAIRFPANIAKVVLKEACKQDVLFTGYSIQPHQGKYVMNRPHAEVKPLKLRVSSQPTDVAGANTEDVVGSFEQVLGTISTENTNAAIIQIYQSLDSEQWPHVARKIIEYGGQLPRRIQSQVDLLVKEGAFVTSSELPAFGSSERLIGYIDIFDSSTTHIILKDTRRDMYRDATQSETTTILSNRRRVEKPNLSQIDYMFGSLELHSYKKDNLKRFEFKLYVPGPSVGKRTGIVCINTKKPFIKESLTSLGVTYTDASLKGETKDTLCLTLAIELLKKKRLFMAPTYKPI